VKVQSLRQRSSKNGNLRGFKNLEEKQDEGGSGGAWKFDMPRKNRRTEKALRQNVTTPAKRRVSFCANGSDDFPAIYDRLRHDLISTRTEVHEMVDVDRSWHRIEKLSKEDAQEP